MYVFIEIKQPNLAELFEPMARKNGTNFVRIAKGPDALALGAIILVKFEIFKAFGDVNPHPWADQSEIWQGGADLRSAPQAKFRLDRYSVSPLRGDKLEKSARE